MLLILYLCWDRPIYLILPADKLDSHGRWLRLMVSCTIRAVIQDPETKNNKVLFLLDEFAALGYMPIIKKAMGIIRGYGMMIWPILQNLSQLKSLYPDDYETFIANADVIQVFGVNDFTTADYISKKIGTTTIETLNENRNHRDGNISNGESHGLAARLLIMPDEVMKITNDQMLLLTSQQNPYKVLKPIYYKLSYFRSRMDLNPYHDHQYRLTNPETGESICPVKFLRDVNKKKRGENK